MEEEGWGVTQYIFRKGDKDYYPGNQGVRTCLRQPFEQGHV